MPALAAGYAHYLAAAYGHEDHVWEEPYDASPVHARAHLLACMRYIEENPVRAGLAGTLHEHAALEVLRQVADALHESPLLARQIERGVVVLPRIRIREEEEGRAVVQQRFADIQARP